MRFLLLALIASLVLSAAAQTCSKIKTSEECQLESCEEIPSDNCTGNSTSDGCDYNCTYVANRSESCNDSDPYYLDLLDTQFLFEEKHSGSTIYKLCTCPSGTIAVGTACQCIAQNQQFNGRSCICRPDDFIIDGICISCPYPCLQCDSSGLCLSCIEGYFLTADNICQGVPTGVHGVMLHNSIVYECPAGCITCTFSEGCSACADAYYLRGNECVSCTYEWRNCRSCASGQGCTECFPAFYLSGLNCESCPSNCLACERHHCLACIYGYYPDDNICSPCTDRGCLSCPHDICEACLIGYTLVQDECVQCIVGCTICSSLNLTVCQGCDSGYYSQNQICLPCQVQCQTCISQFECTACSSGYRLSGSFCVPICTFPCLNCLFSDPSSCRSCYGPYVLSGSSCVQDLGCNANSSCQFCPRNYHLSEDSLCESCNIDDCIRCKQEGNENHCTKCAPGYALFSAWSCVACPSSCLTCSSYSFCLTCSSGYYMYKNNGESTGKCLACSAEDACLECRAISQSCQICKQGYTLNSSVCRSTTYLSYSIQMQILPSLFLAVVNGFKDGLLSMLRETADSLNRAKVGLLAIENRKKIQIDSIKDGSNSSTIIGGAISFDNASQGLSFKEFLISQLEKLMEIDGVRVISFTITLSSLTATPEPLPVQDKISPGVIAGVVLIIVGIVALVILGAVLLRREMKRKKDESTPSTLYIVQSHGELLIY